MLTPSAPLPPPPLAALLPAATPLRRRCFTSLTKSHARLNCFCSCHSGCHNDPHFPPLPTTQPHPLQRLTTPPLHGPEVELPKSADSIPIPIAIAASIAQHPLSPLFLSLSPLSSFSCNELRRCGSPLFKWRCHASVACSGSRCCCCCCCSAVGANLKIS